MSRGVRTQKLPLEEIEIEVASPVLVGVVGDTHLSEGRMRRVLDPVVDLFRRAHVGLILHTGDIGQAVVLDELANVAPTSAVRGNADARELIESLPDRIRINAGKRTVLLLHGHHGKTARAAAIAAVEPGMDMVIYGHSHRPLIEQVGGVILFNPGSPSERRWNPHFGVGLIRIADDAIEPELVLFGDPAHLRQITFPGEGSQVVA